MTALATVPTQNLSAVETALVKGDLSKLNESDRLNYYQSLCKSLGLNPLSKPFEYITLNNKLTLYARKDATDQLRKLNGVSIEKPDIQQIDNLIIVTVSATDKTGRADSDIGVVNKADMRGDLANCLMKAVTKAKRRVTLSICGLGMLDETEVETITDAKPFVEKPQLPKAEEPQVIKDLWATCKALNESGDQIQWTKKETLAYANTLFGSEYQSILDLKDEEKGFLLEDLQIRLNERKAMSEPIEGEVVEETLP